MRIDPVQNRSVTHWAKRWIEKSTKEKSTFTKDLRQTKNILDCSFDASIIILLNPLAAALWIEHQVASASPSIELLGLICCVHASIRFSLWSLLTTATKAISFFDSCIKIQLNLV